MKTDFSQERVTIGKVLKPRGVRGEVKVLPLTDIPDRFEQLETVYVEIAHKQVRRLTIERVRYYKGLVYLFFQGLNTIEDVQDFVGNPLQVERSQVPELPEGVFYHFEIIGLEVYTDNSQYVGRVVDILETGANDVYIVRDKEREHLIPAHKDIVTEINLEKGMITVHPLKGLLDL